MSIKKLGLLSGICVVVISISVYFYLDRTLVNTVYSNPDWDPYTNAEELESASDLIAIVKPTGEKKHIMEKDNGGIPIWYWTESTVLIQEIVYSRDGLVKPGENIIVIEPYSIGENTTVGKLEILQEDYTKLIENNEYVIHLKKKEKEDVYLPVAKDQGKINISQLENSKFSGIHKEVLDKYELSIQ
ncbi:hypothetical protein [Paenibacillus sp. TC-CSREp1]|uniref:hypothetical protein n=1 Tax=Paenibacillus sp. TC-CSREp1 TaxID=3410089 RepID=UPI003CEC56C7